MGNGMNRVLPGLYLGNYRDSKDEQQLRGNRITHIVAIYDNARKLLPDKEYLCIPAADNPGQNLLQFIPICNDFIHDTRLSGGNVLIHCLAGMSRSVTLVCAYIMSVTSLSWRESLKAVRGARHVANPNIGFQKQLQTFENDILNNERKRLTSKYNGNPLQDLDEQMCERLLLIYHYTTKSGDPIDGLCPPGQACPTGICTHAQRLLNRREAPVSRGSRNSSPSRSLPSSPRRSVASSSRSSSRHSSPAPTPPGSPRRTPKRS